MQDQDQLTVQDKDQYYTKVWVLVSQNESLHLRTGSIFSLADSERSGRVR